MTGTRLERLPEATGAGTDLPPGFAERAEPLDHPMRQRTEAVVSGDWDDGIARSVSDFFDDLAPGWAARFHDEEHDAPLRDAFERGALRRAQRCLELGSGPGLTTGWLAERSDVVVATDLSLAMLREAPADVGVRVRADGARLPFADGAFDGIALINVFLFAEEIDRVLAPTPGAWVLWVNTLGDRTPIHLPAERVLDELPGAWSGRTATCGAAIWLAAGRDGLADSPS